MGTNNLSNKKFWHNNWLSLPLPSKFWQDYSHEIIVRKINQYIDKKYNNFLEIGGCPGHWADYFYNHQNINSDSLDYDYNNLEITKKNYKMLGIKGNVFWGDITKIKPSLYNKYDIVLSDGLIEHFKNSEIIVKNHLKLLNKNGLLIIAVPNIKESFIYNFFSKYNKISYNGFRNISIDELKHIAEANKLEIKYCNYLGVVNIGVINSSTFPQFFIKLHTLINYFVEIFVHTFKIKKESKHFSPYIFLIAKK